MLNDTVIDIPPSEPHHSTGYQEWLKQIKQFSAAAQIAIEAQHKPKKRKMGPWLAVRTLQRMEDTDLPEMNNVTDKTPTSNVTPRFNDFLKIPEDIRRAKRVRISEGPNA
jgi:hypothetical protein